MLSHDINQQSIITISLSTKDNSILQIYCAATFKVTETFFSNIPVTVAPSATLTCLLHNMKRHYHVQRSFPHLPIRGQKTQSSSPTVFI